jgi:hypothetical protein
MLETTVPQNLLDRRALRPYVDSVPFMEIQIPEEEIIVIREAAEFILDPQNRSY